MIFLSFYTGAAVELRALFCVQIYFVFLSPQPSHGKCQWFNISCRLINVLLLHLILCYTPEHTVFPILSFFHHCGELFRNKKNLYATVASQRGNSEKNVIFVKVKDPWHRCSLSMG